VRSLPLDQVRGRNDILFGFLRGRHFWNLEHWSRVSRDYLLFGLPAGSRFGEGSCL